ncbi:MAG: hypothetical protein ACREID_01220 [Planctomycetota bacterium]
MKPVAILAVTNALALGLVVVLYVQHDDLSDQLASGGRASSSRRLEAEEFDPARIDRLVREKVLELMAADAGGPGAAAKTEGAGGPSGERAEPPAFPTDAAATGSPEPLDGPAMESFRKQVRRAVELNQDEDQVKQVIERLDRLVEERQIGALTDPQKEKAAKTLVATRRKIPEIWRKVMADAGGQQIAWEERRNLIQTEYATLRASAQKEMEEYLPAPDAKRIAEDALRDRGAGLIGASQGQGSAVFPFGGRRGG